MKRIILNALFAISPLILFSQQNSEWRLDSTENYWKAGGIASLTRYEYLENGLLSQENRFSFEDGKFTNDHRIAYTYDLMGNLITKKIFGCQRDIDSLFDSEREMYSYTSDGQLLEKTYYYNDPYTGLVIRDGAMGVETGKRVYQYDNDGNLTRILWNTIYDIIDIDLNDTLFYLFQYDSSGHLIKEKSYEPGPLGPKERILEYTNDLNGNIIEKIIYDWGDTYHPLKNNSDWDDWELFDLKERERIIYSYNDNGDVTEEGIYGDWYPRIIYTYDESGNLKEEEKLSGYDGYKEMYNYDEYGNLIVHTSYYRPWKENDYRPVEKTFLFWSERSTAVADNTSSNKLSVYPNPVSNFLTIETDKPDHYSIEITSLNGQLVNQREMEGTTHQIDLSSFQKGVYFITIRSKGFVTTRKIVKL